MNIDNRIRNHLGSLKRGNHHSIHLQNAWNKYGKESFIFHIIEYCPENRLLELEQIYIDGLKPEYNISKSSHSPMKGRKHSKKTLDNFKDRKVWNKGILRTEEEINNISQGRIIANKNKPPEYKEFLSNKTKQQFKKHGHPFKDKHHTKENKEIFRNLRKSKKRIICIDTGELFEAQIDITRTMGLRQGHISEHLAGKRLSVKGYKFKYE